MACARGLGPGSTGCACRPAINSIDTHVTRPDVTTEPTPDFRPCKQSLQSCLPWVRVTSIPSDMRGASNLLMRHVLSPPYAARCQSSSSPIIIERFPTPAVRTCVRTDQNLISPPSILRLSIWILWEAYVVPSYIMRTMSYIIALQQSILMNIPTDHSPLPRLDYCYHQVDTLHASPQAPEACFTRTSNCERQLPPAEPSPTLNEP